MTAKKESSKTREVKPRSAKTKSSIRKPASSQSVEVKPANTTNTRQEPQTEAILIDGKLLKTIRSLAGYLSIAVAFNVFALIIQFWATSKAGFVLTWVSFVYIFFSVVLICTLAWCIYLLKLRRLLAFWVFVGFIMINFVYWFSTKLLDIYKINYI